MSKELLHYAEQFLRLGYRIAQENADISTHDGWNITNPQIEWATADTELEKAIEEMKKAALGQESSQLEIDCGKTIYDE